MRENLRTPEQCKSLFARVSHSDAQNNQKGGAGGGAGGKRGEEGRREIADTAGEALFRHLKARSAGAGTAVRYEAVCLLEKMIQVGGAGELNAQGGRDIVAEVVEVWEYEAAEGANGLCLPFSLSLTPSLSLLYTHTHTHTHTHTFLFM